MALGKDDNQGKGDMPGRKRRNRQRALSPEKDKSKKQKNRDAAYIFRHPQLKRPKNWTAHPKASSKGSLEQFTNLKNPDWYGELRPYF